MTSSIFDASTVSYLTEQYCDQLLSMQRNEHESRVRRQEFLELKRMFSRYAAAKDDCDDDDDDNLCDDTVRPSSSSTVAAAFFSPIDAVRDMPELMLQVYSFLPVYDRVCSLARVDRRFANDKVRSGIRFGCYGPAHISLWDALNELHWWVSCVRYYPRHKTRIVDRKQDLAMVDKMFKLRCDVYYKPSAMAQLFNRESSSNICSSWMEDLVSLEQAITLDLENSFNFLAELIQEVGFEESFRQYTNEVEGAEGDDVLTRLDAGFCLTLLHSDYGREEHHAVTCSECGKLHLTYRTISCEHRHEFNICKTCDTHADLINSCNQRRRVDVRCEWGCYECRMKTNRYERRAFRLEIEEQATYNFDFQLGIEEMLMEVAPERQDDVRYCLMRGVSPRDAYSMPLPVACDENHQSLEEGTLYV